MVILGNQRVPLVYLDRAMRIPNPTLNIPGTGEAHLDRETTKKINEMASKDQVKFDFSIDSHQNIILLLSVPKLEIAPWLLFLMIQMNR